MTQTLRTFDLEKRQWAIYWVSNARGKQDPPVVGGFDGCGAVTWRFRNAHRSLYESAL